MKNFAPLSYLQLLEMWHHEKWISLQSGQIVVTQVTVKTTKIQMNMFCGKQIYIFLDGPSINFNKPIAREIKYYAMNRKGCFNRLPAFRSRKTFLWAINQTLNGIKKTYWTGKWLKYEDELRQQFAVASWQSANGQMANATCHGHISFDQTVVIFKARFISG